MENEGHLLDIDEQMAPGITIRDNLVPQYKKNNVLACLLIPEKRRNQGYEELVQFICGHPLNTAFTLAPEVIIPQVFLEFWYTCSAQSLEANVIRGTINNGRKTIRITPKSLRYVLKLPDLTVFDDFVSRTVARSVLLEIGNPTATGVISRSQFSTRWGFLISTIVRCLGGKTGSLNQVNDMEMQILHSMVKGRDIDYAQLIFNDLRAHVLKPKREPVCPYVRFISLCIQESVGDLYDRLGTTFESIPPPELSNKIFKDVIREDEVPITVGMQFWIRHPFNLETSSSESVEGDQSRGSEHSDDSQSSPSSSEGRPDETPSQANPPSPPSSTHPLPPTQTYKKGTSLKNPILQRISEADATLAPSSAPIDEMSSILERLFPPIGNQPEPDVEPTLATSSRAMGEPIADVSQTHETVFESMTSPQGHSPPSSPLNMPNPIHPTATAVTYSTSLDSLHLLAQAVNIMPQNQGTIQASTSVTHEVLTTQQVTTEVPPPPPFISESFTPTSQLQELQSMIKEMMTKLEAQDRQLQALLPTPTPAPTVDLSELTQAVTDLTASFTQFTQTQNDRHSIVMSEIAAIKSTQERLQNQITELQSQIPNSSSLTKTVKDISDAAVAIDQNIEQAVSSLQQHFKADYKVKEDLVRGIDMAKFEFELQKQAFQTDAEISEFIRSKFGRNQEQIENILSQLTQIAKSLLNKEKSIDDDKKGEKRRRDDDDDDDSDAAAGDETGLQQYRRRKRERLIVDLTEQEDSQAEKTKSQEKDKGKQIMIETIVEEPLPLQIEPPQPISPQHGMEETDSEDDLPIAFAIKRRKGKVIVSESESEEEMGESTAQKAPIHPRMTLEEIAQNLQAEEPRIQQLPLEVRTQAREEASQDLLFELEEQFRLRDEADMVEDLSNALKRRYFEGSIIKVGVVKELVIGRKEEKEEDVLVLTTSENPRARKLRVSQIHLLGLMEWKEILHCIKNMRNRDLLGLKDQIKKEIFKVMSRAEVQGEINREEVVIYFTAMQWEKKKPYDIHFRPDGLLCLSEDQRLKFPEGLTFEDATASTQPAGFMYIDKEGELCFQSFIGLYLQPTSHILSMKTICKDVESNRWWLKKLNRVLRSRMTELKRRPELKTLVTEIENEQDPDVS